MVRLCVELDGHRRREQRGLDTGPGWEALERAIMAKLCRFHHQVVIHRWGWTLVLSPDGTATPWNKDKTKVLHSHGPPARAG
jgi:hypothetical protein